MIELAAVAAAGSLDNLGVTVGMGVHGHLSTAARIRKSAVFGLFEAGMPLVGLLAGQHLAGPIGKFASPIAGLMLLALGVHALASSEDEPRGGTFLPAALVSIDNLAVGIALGIHQTSLLVIPMFAVASVTVAFTGLSFGALLASKTDHAGKVGALALILVGILIGTGVMG